MPKRGSKPPKQKENKKRPSRPNLDLDDVLLSAATYHAWFVVCETAVAAIVASGAEKPGAQIVDEQCEVLASGELRIFARIGQVEVSLNVPPGQWAYASRKQ